MATAVEESRTVGEPRTAEESRTVEDMIEGIENAPMQPFFSWVLKTFPGYRMFRRAYSEQMLRLKLEEYYTVEVQMSRTAAQTAAQENLQAAKDLFTGTNMLGKAMTTQLRNLLKNQLHPEPAPALEISWSHDLPS